MKKTLLFSDVHLKAVPADRPRREEFISFLDSVTPDHFDRIICAGDLFDFWFEYKSVIFSDFFQVLCAFKRLRDDGIEIHLACGNHDFWAGRFLRDELGFHIHPDEAWIPFGDKNALLVHGDGLNPKDRAYRVYKRIARNPLVVGAFRLLHPDGAMALARFVSHGSRTLKAAENPAEGEEAQALRDYGKSQLAQGKADIVITGHAHAPAVEPYPTTSGTGYYVNPGDWLVHRSYVVWDGAEFRLADTRTTPLPSLLDHGVAS